MRDEPTQILPTGTPAHQPPPPLKYQPTAMEQMLGQEEIEVRALQSIANSLKFFVWVTCIGIFLAVLGGAAYGFILIHNTTPDPQIVCTTGVNC